MKLILGFLMGLGTAWAALAIWQRLPEFPDIDDEPLADITGVHDMEHGVVITGRFRPPYYSDAPAPPYSE